MNTLTLHQPGQLRYTASPPLPPPGVGQVRLRIHRVGVCGTDYHAYRGRQPFFTYPRVLGHELGAEVVAVGEGVADVRPGDHCSVEPYLNCGNCQACRLGKPNCCLDMRVLGVHTDGGFRELINIAAHKVHVSKTLSFDQLALVEPLGIGCHAANRAALTPQDTVLVIGAGPIGLAVVAFARLSGARVVVMDINTDRLRFCVEATGSETMLKPTDPPGELRERLRGDLPTAVFDATGNAQSMQEAFGWVAHGGRLVFVGLFQGEVTFNDPDFHRRELTLMASRNALPADFRFIIERMETGQLSTSAWITHRADFGQVADRFGQWLDPTSQVVKAMVSVT